MTYDLYIYEWLNGRSNYFLRASDGTRYHSTPNLRAVFHQGIVHGSIAFTSTCIATNLTSLADLQSRYPELFI